jgi:hypothetical protein
VPESELLRQVELPLQCRQMRSPAHSLWNGVEHLRQGRIRLLVLAGCGLVLLAASLDIYHSPEDKNARTAAV